MSNPMSHAMPASQVPANRRIHPLMAVAAVSITALCLTGIAAMTGHLGGSQAQSASGSTPVAALAGATANVAEDKTSAAGLAAAANPATNSAAPANAAPAATSTAAVAPVVAVAPTPRHIAPRAVANPAPRAAEPMPAPAPQASIDPSIGTVTAINRVDISPANNGVGAVGGGVLGAVVGHQFGGGRGKDVGTVLGAIGGAVAGNAVETHERKTYRYDVQVRGDDGASHTLRYSSPPAFGVGDKISLKSNAQG